MKCYLKKNRLLNGQKINILCHLLENVFHFYCRRSSFHIECLTHSFHTTCDAFDFTNFTTFHFRPLPLKTIKYSFVTLRVNYFHM